MTKNYLFIMRQPPHKGTGLQETLDMVLTIAAFDQPVSLLFVDEGVWQLKNHQQPESAGLKDTSAIFNALALYDINDLYVETESLSANGLTMNDLILPVNLIDRTNIHGFSRQYNVVFSG